MSTLNLTLQAVGMVAGALIMHHAISAIDRMSAETRHGVRVAFVLIATGGFAALTAPMLPESVQSGIDLFLPLGVAALMIYDRRCVACPRAVALGAWRRRRDEALAPIEPGRGAAANGS